MGENALVLYGKRVGSFVQGYPCFSASLRAGRFVVFTLATLLQVNPAHARREIILAADFSQEASTVDKRLRASGNPLTTGNYEITRKQSCDRVRSLWISLLPSNPVAFRSELRIVKPVSLEYGTDYEVSLSLCVPEFPPDLDEEVVVLQFHSWPDLDLGETWKSPHLRLGIVKGKWQITSLADERKLTPPKRHPADTRYRTQKLIDAGRLRFNRWETWTFKVRFSPFADGALEILRDDEIIGSWSGPNAFNDLRGPFLKFGLYVPAKRSGDAVRGPRNARGLSLAVKALSVERDAAAARPISDGTGRPEAPFQKAQDDAGGVQ